MPTQTKNWIYTQILEYTDIPQDWKKSKFAKEKAKKLLTGLNNAATNDAEEGLSMAEITKALKKPVWEAAYENAQLTKDRYLAYSYCGKKLGTIATTNLKAIGPTRIGPGEFK